MAWSQTSIERSASSHRIEKSAGRAHRVLREAQEEFTDYREKLRKSSQSIERSAGRAHRILREARVERAHVEVERPVDGCALLRILWVQRVVFPILVYQVCTDGPAEGR